MKLRCCSHISDEQYKRNSRLVKLSAYWTWNSMTCLRLVVHTSEQFLFVSAKLSQFMIVSGLRNLKDTQLRMVEKNEICLYRRRLFEKKELFDKQWYSKPEEVIYIVLAIFKEDISPEFFTISKPKLGVNLGGGWRLEELCVKEVLKLPEECDVQPALGLSWDVQWCRGIGWSTAWSCSRRLF